MPRGIPRSTEAKYNPVIMSNALDSLDHEVPQGTERLMKSTGDANESLDKIELARASEHVYDTEKFQMLAFMAEPVTLRIASTTDKNADQVFEINVNGKCVFFRRGETKVVPRYIADRMLRLKETRYEQREVLNKEGIREFLHIPITGLKYDFSVSRDDNPLGTHWFKAVMSEPG